MYRPLMLLVLMVCLASCSEKKKKAHKHHSIFQQVFPFALRGEMNKVFEVLDTVNERYLSEEEMSLKREFYERFIYRSEAYNYKTQDSIIIGFVDHFHSYWNKVMVDGQSVEKADSLFRNEMASYLFKARYEDENISVDTITQDMYKYGNAFLEDKGYHANAFGKTVHLYDLFLWKKEVVKRYPVSLIDDSIEVTVHLMDDFISTGWTHYTTFGRRYASGWANREALYCVVSAYDTASENFRVSYLAHEGQHFADYQQFPNLQQRDLEYRAKLVELAKSDKTTNRLIENFISNASDESMNAHAFANYCVIRDLSRAVFEKDFVTKADEWQSNDPELIKEKSQELFHAHTEGLKSAGSETVETLIE